MSEVRVRTQTGRLIGTDLGGCFRFLGIPFARPPVGPSAFEPPIRLPASDETVACLRYAATVPQVPPRSIIPFPIIDGENCLNLNIWTPSLADDRLPVLVWFHGGGYNWGCNASPWFDGRNFARDGVVLVAANFRVGAEGFLCLGEKNLNRSYRDNLLALSWLQENITAFGGDPDRITVGGQSSGGRTSLTLFTAPAAAGLFRRALSVSPGSAHTKTREDAQRMAQAYAETAGVTLSPEGLASIPAERRQVIDLAYAGSSDHPIWTDSRPVWRKLLDHYGKDAQRWGPVLDDEIVTADSYVRSAAGTVHNGEALLIGTTAEENTGSVAAQALGMSQESLTEALEAIGLDPAAAERYLALSRRRGSPGWALGQAMTDWHFRLPTLRVARSIAQAGRSVYRYEFRWVPHEPGPGPDTSMHNLDIPFAFDNLAADTMHRLGIDPPQELASAIHAAWVRFVDGSARPWAPFRPDAPVTMIFDGGPMLRSDTERSIDAIWHGHDGLA